MPSSRRTERIKGFIKRTLGEIIHEEIIRQDVLITIMNVKTSPDLQWADVSVSIFPYDKHEEIMEILKNNAGVFQEELNHRLRIRHTPKIRFELDSRMEAGIFEDLEGKDDGQDSIGT